MRFTEIGYVITLLILGGNVMSSRRFFQWIVSTHKRWVVATVGSQAPGRFHWEGTTYHYRGAIDII
jgi:hypothetical protein